MPTSNGPCASCDASFALESPRITFLYFLSSYYLMLQLHEHSMVGDDRCGAILGLGSMQEFVYSSQRGSSFAVPRSAVHAHTSNIIQCRW